MTTSPELKEALSEAMRQAAMDSWSPDVALLDPDTAANIAMNVLTAFPRPSAQGEGEGLREIEAILTEHIGAQMHDRHGNPIVWSPTSAAKAIQAIANLPSGEEKAAPAQSADEVEKPWAPCVVRDLVCDGEWHRGWDGHDPYIARCPRPKPEAEKQAHSLLGEFCACYAEAWPAATCATEAKRLADRLSAISRPVVAEVRDEYLDEITHWIGFSASAIRCGEDWLPTTEDRYQKAIQARDGLKRILAALGSGQEVGR